MTAQEDLETACRAENERMMQDHIRLCGALGLDADAHVDMLADAAEGLRAECERLKADNLDLINTLEAEGFHNEAAAIRIAELEAALGETIEEVNEALPYIIDGTPENELVGWRKRHVACAREVLCRAAAALKEAE